MSPFRSTPSRAIGVEPSPEEEIPELAEATASLAASSVSAIVAIATVPQRCLSPRPPIDLASVPDRNNQHDERLALDLIDDAVVASTDSIEVRLLASRCRAGSPALSTAFAPELERKPARNHARQGAGPQRDAHSACYHGNSEYEAKQMAECDQCKKNYGASRHGFHGLLLFSV
jgi:hypothetical protein